MFKTLKKKITDEGAGAELNLSTVSSAGSLGSSMSSLRRAGSKTSNLSHSQESLQSLPESFKTITTVQIEETEKEDGEKISPQPLLIEPDLFDTYSAKTISPPLITHDLSLEGPENNRITPVDAGDVWNSVQDEFHDFTSGPVPDNVLTMVEQSVTDSSPVLVPFSPMLAVPELQKKNSSTEIITPSCDHSQFVKEIEKLKHQLSEKAEQEKVLQRRLSSQESDRASFRAELNRLKEMQSQNRQCEEKLKNATVKLGDMTQQLDNEKTEKNSWKIAHDQVGLQLKEKSLYLQTVQKKVTDLDNKLTSLNLTTSDHRRENEKLKDDNASLKNAVDILERQVDKFITDIQAEKAAKESANNKVRSVMEENLTTKSAVDVLGLQIRKLEAELEAEKIASGTAAALSKEVLQLKANLESQEKRTDDVQQLDTVAYKNLQEEHAAILSDLRSTLTSKHGTISDLTTDLHEKSDVILSLEDTVKNLETRLKTVEENLESKEATLAVFRRRSAKDTELKLRERDRQISNLEKQIAELEERTNTIETVNIPDHTSNEYTKNVVMKFLSGSGEERLQLLRAVSVVLQMTESEEIWLKEVIAWKQSWLPGPKPELPHIAPSHSSDNGTS